MHQRGRPGARFDHIHHGGQFFEIEFYLIREIFRFGTGRRDAHRHEFADLADLAGGEHRLIGGFEAFET